MLQHSTWQCKFLIKSTLLKCSFLPSHAWQLLRLCNAQPLKRLLKVIRQWRLQNQLLSTPRVCNPHSRSVEQLSRRKRHLHNQDQSLASLFTCACCLTTARAHHCIETCLQAVDLIPNNSVPSMRHMHPDLVRPACAGRAAQQGGAPGQSVLSVDQHLNLSKQKRQEKVGRVKETGQVLIPGVKGVGFSDQLPGANMLCNVHSAGADHPEVCA